MRLDLVELALAADERGAAAAAGCSGSCRTGSQRSPLTHHPVDLVAVGRRRERRSVVARPRTARPAPTRPSSPSGRATASRRRSRPAPARASGVSSVCPPSASDITRAAVGLARPSTSSGLAPRATSSALFSRRITGPTCSPARAFSGTGQRGQRAVVGQRVAHRIGGGVEHQQHAVGLVDLAAAPDCGSRSRATRSCAAHTPAMAASPSASDSLVLSTTSVSRSARKSAIRSRVSRFAFVPGANPQGPPAAGRLLHPARPPQGMRGRSNSSKTHAPRSTGNATRHFAHHVPIHCGRA